jgi:hypothetical protein
MDLAGLGNPFLHSLNQRVAVQRFAEEEGRADVGQRIQRSIDVSPLQMMMGVSGPSSWRSAARGSGR